jgi:hypothetical protein
LVEGGREARAQSKARRAEGNNRFAAAATLQGNGIGEVGWSDLSVMWVQNEEFVEDEGL